MIDNLGLIISAKQYLQKFDLALDKDIHAMGIEGLFKEIGVLDSRTDYDSNLEPIVNDVIDFEEN